MEHQTYRKPLCSYMYTPADSFHADCVSSGIASTEFFRRLLTNDSEASYMFHSEFFIGKLVRCGYKLKSVRGIAGKIAWSNRSSILARQDKSSANSVIPFKIAYAADVSQLYISRTLLKHQYVLGNHIVDARLLTAFKTSPNIFRSRFEDKYV